MVDIVFSSQSSQIFSRINLSDRNSIQLKITFSNKNIIEYLIFYKSDVILNKLILLAYNKFLSPIFCGLVSSPLQASQSTMKNFIQINIDKVSGNRRGSSLIEREPKYFSPVKAKSKYLDQYNQNSNKKQYSNMKEKVQRMESQINQLAHSRNDRKILQDISEIKDDIKLIKSYLFGSGNKKQVSFQRHYQEPRQNLDQQETIYGKNKQMRMKSYGSDNSDQHYHTVKQNSYQHSNGSSPHKRVYKIQDIIDQKMKRSTSENSKPGSISVKNLITMAKDYKLEHPQFGTMFYGYSKRTSQPIALKYCEKGLEQVIEVYDKLWKNITKAQWPCINRIYDYKSEDTSILVMQKNRSNIVGLPYKNILIDIVKILEFIHDCGYLYRNIQPEHFMLNQEDQLVIIDFKRSKRYIDIKGHPMQIKDAIYTGSPFASNNQVRGLPESRKDDLQSLGYLALLLLEMEIPWAGMNKDQVIKIRSSLTLQELYSKEPEWIQFMAYVMKLPKHQRPDYKYLCEVISRN